MKKKKQLGKYGKLCYDFACKINGYFLESLIKAPKPYPNYAKKMINRWSEKTAETAESMKNIVSTLAFELYRDGIETVDEAVYVMGFPPGDIPDRTAVRTRYRTMASILHPDSGYGSHNHMSQLNAAMDLLRSR